MKKLAAVVAAVAITFGANVLFACGGGSSVTMTVDTEGTFDSVPAVFTVPGDANPVDQVM